MMPPTGKQRNNHEKRIENRAVGSDPCRRLHFMGAVSELGLSITTAATIIRPASASMIIGTVSVIHPTVIADFLALSDHPEADVGVSPFGITSDSAGFCTAFRTSAVPRAALDRTLIANGT